MRVLIAVLLTSLLLVLAACGQKGPLYLPGNGPDSGHAGDQQSARKTNSQPESGHTDGTAQ